MYYHESSPSQLSSCVSTYPPAFLPSSLPVYPSTHAAVCLSPVMEDYWLASGRISIVPSSFSVR
jgi:hypothetical protein